MIRFVIALLALATTAQAADLVLYTGQQGTCFARSQKVFCQPVECLQPAPTVSPTQSATATRTPTPQPTATPIAPMPMIAKWEADMLLFGRQHCEFLKNTANGFDPRLLATYYDAQWVYQQIKQYTGDPYWDGCATAAEAVYRDAYARPNNGTVPGYWNFTRGLADDFVSTADPISKAAAIQLSQNAAFARDTTQTAETVSFLASREVSYAILSYLDAMRLGEPRRGRLSLLVDHSFGHFEQWFVARSGYVKPFMVGLWAATFIEYDKTNLDARTLPAIRTAADWMWANVWDANSKSFLYIERAVAGEDPPNPAPDLNQLIAPMYAWLWNKTRDPKYRDQADQIFQGGVLGAYLVNPKQFNQSYRLSFATVRLRNS